MQVAEAAEAGGDSALAISMYTEAAASEPANIALQLRAADALARNGKVVQARQMLAARLRSNPRQPDLLRASALIDLVTGQPAQAIAGLDLVLAVTREMSARWLTRRWHSICRDSMGGAGDLSAGAGDRTQ